MKKGFTIVELLITAGILAVMAFIVISLAGTGSSNTSNNQSSLFYPEPTNYVVDSANVLSDETEQKLNEQLKDFDSTAQIAVVTVETTQPLDEKEYSIELAERWKVGHKDVDNGVILLIVTKDRRVRIEVGRGLEGTITDGKAGQILDNSVVPFLKNNNWDEAAVSGVNSIVEQIKGGEQK